MECHLDNEPYVMPERPGPNHSDVKSEHTEEEKSVDIFPNFRCLLNNEEITSYRRESGERFRLQDWAENRAGFELINLTSERLCTGDEGLAAEYRLAKSLVTREGIHKIMENTAKSLSLFPPLSKEEKFEGVDFQDMSQDFEVICGKFYNFRQLKSIESMESVQFEAMFLSDFGDAYCGGETMNQNSSGERMMLQFVELADKYARSKKEVENDIVKKLFKVIKLNTFISKEGKDQLDKFWSDNQTSILAGAVIAGVLALGLSYLTSKSRQGRSK